MNERLTPLERIRKQKDFSVLYRTGHRYRAGLFHLVYRPNRLGYSRLGCVTSRKVGNAVTRNKIRRWMRDVFRRNKALFVEPWDIIVIARPETAGLTGREFAAAFAAAVEKIRGRRQP